MISQNSGLRLMKSIMRVGTAPKKIGTTKKTFGEICAVSQIKAEIAGNELHGRPGDSNVRAVSPE